MMQRYGFLVFAWFFAMGGCSASQGFQQPVARSAQNAASPQVSDISIEMAFAKRPQLPEHIRIAVYFDTPDMDGVRYENGAEPHRRFSMADRKKVVDALNTQRKVDAFALSKATLPSESYQLDLHALRVAAAEHGADALLVVTMAGASERNPNVGASTYLALAPMLFVPGTQLDAMVMTRAALWDVRNAYLYASAEAEGLSKQTRPLAWIDAGSALTAAKQDALSGLERELRARISRLVQGS